MGCGKGERASWVDRRHRYDEVHGWEETEIHAGWLPADTSVQTAASADEHPVPCSAMQGEFATHRCVLVAAAKWVQGIGGTFVDALVLLRIGSEGIGGRQDGCLDKTPVAAGVCDVVLGKRQPDCCRRIRIGRRQESVVQAERQWNRRPGSGHTRDGEAGVIHQAVKLRGLCRQSC